MDPISIATACVSVLNIITKTVIVVKKYGSTYHEAGTDLAAVLREVNSFQWALERVHDDNTGAIEAGRTSGPVTLDLKTHVLQIVENSKPTLVEIQTPLSQHSKQVLPSPPGG
jgi:hypothetical protein